VAALLGTALALLWPPSDTPYAQHTLVDQAVRATRRRAPASAGFVNAVLRRFVRESEACVARVLGSELGSTNHPAWWVERLRADWPDRWPALIDATNRHPPMTLRVNRRRCSGADYVARLALAGRTARRLAGTAWGGQAVVLDAPCPVHELPGFDAGDVSVQDGSAQRAAPLLLGAGEGALRAGARVLDACAAPGGKTAHLLELADLELLALDVDATRLRRVHENLDRLGLRAELRAADATRPADWWDGRPFDAIVLDAPCTASGIERRHPDVRWLRRPEDVAALARTQAALLDALWPLLAPGGRLLYATCSVFRAEGEQVIDAFLQRRAAERPAMDPAAPGHLLPLPDNADDPAGGTPLAHDGFYYALIHKPAC
jgi:16S rRNA (cytosine967-C5)-methyltransferase